MKTKYTPGPWVFAFGSVYQDDKTKEIDANRLLMADRDNDKTMPTERDANCLLAAAAPELLEALQLDVMFHSRFFTKTSLENFQALGYKGTEDSREMKVWLENLKRAAIAKATGKE